MGRRREIPFEEWSRGVGGYILFCVQDLRLACRRVKQGKDGSVHVYKMEHWAFAHAERFGHKMLAVQEAEPLVRRFLDGK